MINLKKTRKIVAALLLAVALVAIGVGGIAAYGLAADVPASTSAIAEHEVINHSLVLDEDLVLYGLVNGDITVEAGVTLTIAAGGQVNGTVIVNGNLYLLDGGVITGAGRGAIVNLGGVFNMMGGYVRDNSYTDNGGGIWVNGGNFNMHGGRIIENTSYGGYGGGVWIDGHESLFVLFNGEIVHNSSYFAGGGVALTNGNSDNFIMHGGLIEDNTIVHMPPPCDEPCICCP